LSDKQVEYAKTIYGSGVDLLSLINEILDLSKVESGKMRVEPRTIPLEELSDFVKRTFEPVAAEKRLSLTIETSSELTDISTDPQRLQQVLKNLLSNAFKFTDTGGVSLKMMPAPSSMKFEMPTLLLSDKVIAFEVRDTGIGIPKDKQKIVFEAFQQLDGNTNRKYGGTGLGLSISREIARLLGGEIRIESTPGEGSAFTLYLPERVGMDLETLTEEHATPMVISTPRPPIALPPPPPRDSEPSREGRPTILVVDDDFRNIFAMSSILEGRGLNVIYAENGRGALEALNDHDVSLVLLDIMMPEMDGYETIAAIRSTGRHTSLPVVAVTAKALNEDREKCLAVGATDFLPKPVDPDRLLKIIDAYCGVASSTKAAN
jgi:CheY-like chemotaxis protein